MNGIWFNYKFLILYNDNLFEENIGKIMFYFCFWSIIKWYGWFNFVNFEKMINGGWKLRIKCV